MQILHVQINFFLLTKDDKNCHPIVDVMLPPHISFALLRYKAPGFKRVSSFRSVSLILTKETGIHTYIHHLYLNLGFTE